MENGIKRLIKPLIIKVGRSIEKKQFSDTPIIIGACPRSGTTLLLSILDAHPNIYGIQNQTYAFAGWNDNSQANRLDRLYREFIFNKIPENKKRWCEKTPKNIKFFDKILALYGENVKLIHVVRDGRDVVTSKHPKHSPDQYWVSVRRWINDVNLGLTFADKPNVYTIKYEDIINNYDVEIQKLLSFLGEDMVPEVRDWFNHTTVKKSIHWANPVQKLHSKAIGKWLKPEHRRRYAEFMENSEAVALMKTLGYEL
ncbi:sulfotransferase [bacterium]|nr:sulfotransferase [bacterium]MBU1064587.1 sulfotransferase [bacterium]